MSRNSSRHSPSAVTLRQNPVIRADGTGTVPATLNLRTRSEMGRTRITVGRLRGLLNAAILTPLCLMAARLVTRTGNPAFVVSDQVASGVGSSSGGDEGPCPKSRRGLPGGDHVAASGCSAEEFDQAVEDLELGLARLETLAESSGTGFALGDGLLRGGDHRAEFWRRCVHRSQPYGRSKRTPSQPAQRNSGGEGRVRGGRLSSADRQNTWL